MVAPEAMSKEKEWPHSAEVDGWVLAHEALRLDMADFSRAVQALQDQISSGKLSEFPLAWQANAILPWWERFEKSVRDHHHHEEDIFFPEIQKRVELPPKMTSDHTSLLEQLSENNANIKVFLGAKTKEEAASALATLKASFEKMRTEMLPHLAEEEEIALPLMRQHFSHKEFEPTKAKMVKQLKPEDMAWFSRPASTKAEKKAIMSREGIPGFIQWLIMFPACRKYHRRYTAPLEDVIAGQKVGKK